MNKTLIIYWDPFNKNNLNLFSTKNIIINIHSKHLNYLSNKKTCSNYIKNLNLYEYYPKTYDNLSQLNNICIDNLYFIKNIHSTGGKGVKCIIGKDLLNYEINNNEIIQEGITNLKLINNSKFVIRSYIIIFNNNIYLSEYSWCMVHGKKYDTKNPAYDIQIKHEGYMNKASTIKMYPLHETEYASYIYKIKNALINMKELFKPIINNSNNQFIIIGSDILITDKDEIKFIEFNTFPNLIHTKYINDNVNEKMLFDLFNLLFLNYKNNTLLTIE